MLVNKVYCMTQKGGFVFSLLVPAILNHQPLLLRTLKQSNSGNLTSVSARVWVLVRDPLRMIQEVGVLMQGSLNTPYCRVVVLFLKAIIQGDDGITPKDQNLLHHHWQIT